VVLAPLIQVADIMVVAVEAAIMAVADITITDADKFDCD